MCQDINRQLEELDLKSMKITTYVKTNHISKDCSNKSKSASFNESQKPKMLRFTNDTKTHKQTEHPNKIPLIK